MEVDTGPSLSVISEKKYESLLSEGKAPSRETSGVVLGTSTGEEIKPKGSCVVDVFRDGEQYSLPLLVVGGEGPSVLGGNWLGETRLNWPSIKLLTPHDERLKGILKKHAHFFEDPTASPIFQKSRPVPYALWGKIEHDLKRLQKAGTIEPVHFSEWVTPVVIGMKTDCSVKVCGDYKLTVNKVSKLDGYPIPKLDDLCTKLAGGQPFTELDLSHVYEQTLVDEGSREFLTINTHKGLYRYNRLPYGASSAHDIFHRTMKVLLQGMPSTGVLLDNILIAGLSPNEQS